MIKIRYYRERMGFTMKELAQRVGCTESAISNYELGKREASYETLLRIAEALETAGFFFISKGLRAFGACPKVTRIYL